MEVNEKTEEINIVRIQCHLKIESLASSMCAALK